MRYVSPGSHPQYDNALICENGHVLNSNVRRTAHRNSEFCATCGAPAVPQCRECSTKIRGGLGGSTLSRVPSFCINCGKPYPWTANRLLAARELALELEGLDDDERLQLASTFDDLIADTPRTELAATRFKKLVQKVKGEGGTALRDVITRVATEAVKRHLGL